MSEAVKSRQSAPLATSTDLGGDATKDIGGGLNILSADVLALWMKTKNFHWHVSGPHFRDYHLMLDEQSDQIHAMVDLLVERARKLGGKALHSIGQVQRLQRVLDNDADYVTPQDVLAELREDTAQLVKNMRVLHEMCDGYNDLSTASLLENWIDESEQRAWFLFEASRHG
jgi:starvation-inducible DNA-binding protein